MSDDFIIGIIVGALCVGIIATFVVCIQATIYKKVIAAANEYIRALGGKVPGEEDDFDRYYEAHKPPWFGPK